MTEKRVVPMRYRDPPTSDRQNWPCVLDEHAPPPPDPKDGRWISGEPDLQDLLSDPIIHAIMKRDGLSLEDLQQAIVIARCRLAPAADRLTASNAA